MSCQCDVCYDRVDGDDDDDDDDDGVGRGGEEKCCDLFAYSC